jgi:hypothetical protein
MAMTPEATDAATLMHPLKITTGAEIKEWVYITVASFKLIKWHRSLCRKVPAADRWHGALP